MDAFGRRRRAGAVLPLRWGETGDVEICTLAGAPSVTKDLKTHSRPQSPIVTTVPRSSFAAPEAAIAWMPPRGRLHIGTVAGPNKEITATP
jgi:hypothetical protein